LSESLLDQEGLPTRIGDGQPGGKAQGLLFFRDMLKAEFDPERFSKIEVGVPDFAVITTEMFERFVEDNRLGWLASSDVEDAATARAFLEGQLPDSVEEYLQNLVETVHRPLAVRSSSLLEDTASSPFAGVYGTKMVPNNQPEPAARLQKLAEAIKLVWASTYFAGARRYVTATGNSVDDESMAVIVQRVVGAEHGSRYYPHLSGVGRSFNFYPAKDSKPEQGVVSLALGLGKEIVDGGICWSFSPARPKAPPPYASSAELLKSSQLKFWSLNLAEHDEDPLTDTEHLIRLDLSAAESDGTLAMIASTYDPRSDRIVPGTGHEGPRVVNFAPLLTLGLLPTNELVRELLAIGERAAGADVEIEFAMTLPDDSSTRARLGFLQVRPMHVCNETVEIDDEELDDSTILIRSRKVMGNGTLEGLRDIVFVNPDTFDAGHARLIGAELGALNAKLAAAQQPYVLIGFGRWGSSDPWLGIPVDWDQISAAKVIVESTLPEMNVELSQGSHFFHNISCLGVSYLAVRHTDTQAIDWGRLQGFDVVEETRFLRHVRLDAPLRIKVDGRSGRGGVWL
jgi:hypothetical protein